MNAPITLPDRDTEHERVLCIVFGVSPAQATVLSCLARATIVTADELLAYAGIKDYIKVVVSRTRSKLREHDFDIKSRKGLGYWIEPEDKQGIENVVNKFMEG